MISSFNAFMTYASELGSLLTRRIQRATEDHCMMDLFFGGRDIIFLFASHLCFLYMMLQNLLTFFPTVNVKSLVTHHKIEFICHMYVY